MAGGRSVPYPVQPQGALPLRKQKTEHQKYNNEENVINYGSGEPVTRHGL